MTDDVNLQWWDLPAFQRERRREGEGWFPSEDKFPMCASRLWATRDRHPRKLILQTRRFIVV